MKKTFLIVLVAISSIASAQDYSLPANFTQFFDYDNNPQALSADFDGDAIKDLLVTCESEDYGYCMLVFLSSSYKVAGNYYWFPWESDMNYFSFENGELNISSSFGVGRFGKTLKLKYDRTLKNMRLIEYSESYLGNYEQSGAYEKIIDLVANTFIVNDQVGQLNLEIVTLSNIEQYFDYFLEVGTEYMPVEESEMIVYETDGETIDDEEQLDIVYFEDEVDVRDNPVWLVEKIFEVANTGAYYELYSMCDPLEENDGDTRSICQIADATEEEQGAFSGIFGPGTVTGEVLYTSKTTAKVPITFGYDSEVNEEMNVVLRDGKWYLSSF